MDSDYIQTVRFIYMNIFYSEMTIITALFVSVVLVSCSNDEGDEKIGASSSKHIVREIYDDGRNIVMTEYFYDSRGRVIKTNETEADSRGTKSATSTYTLTSSHSPSTAPSSPSAPLSMNTTPPPNPAFLAAAPQSMSPLLPTKSVSHSPALPSSNPVTGSA